MRWDAVRRLLGRGTVRALAAAFTLALLLWIVIATGLGMSMVIPAALGWMAPEGWTVDAGSVVGAWHSRIRLTDLELEGPDASLSIQELFVDYRVLPLLSRRIELEEVRIVRPTLRADLTAVTGDAAVPEERSDTGGLDILVSGSPLGEWALDLSQLEVRQAEATLRSERGAYAVSHARLTGRAELAPSGVGLHVDTLVAEVTPPGSADSLGQGGIGSGRLVLAARLEDGRLDVTTLSFDSPRSRLAGSGQLLLAPVAGLVDSVDFQLVADPLDLRDLPVALPGPWAAQPRVTARLNAHGAVDSMVVDAEVDGPGETAFDAQAIVRTPSDTLFEDREARPPTLEVMADVQGDLSPWSLGPFDGDLAAELHLRLDSSSLRGPAEVHATLVHRPSADTLGGLIGRDLRLVVDLTRGAASADTLAEPTEAGRRAPLEATVVVSSAVGGPEEWREIGTLRATGTEERADWEMSVELDSGSLAGRGSAQWGGERMAVLVDRFTLEDFDASALAARFPDTDVTALLEGGLSGAAVSELSGTMALQVSPSSFAGTDIRSATLRARLDPGVVEGALMADAAGRELSSDFELTFADSLVSATLSQVRLSSASDTAAEAAVASSAVELRGSATGTWALGDVRRGTFSASLDSGFVAGFPIRDGTVEGRLVGDSVVAQASLRVADVLSAPAWIEGSLRARGTAPENMVGQLRASAVRATAADTTGGAAGTVDSLTVTVSAQEPGRFTLDGALHPAEGGRLDVEGTAAVAGDSVAFDLIAAGGVDGPTSLLREATIDTLRLEASGARDAGAWDALQARLLVRDVAWRGVTADSLLFVLAADAAGLRLDTLDVASEVLTLAGGGRLPQGGAGAGRLDFVASVQLEPLREVVQTELPRIGENAIVASVTGTTDSLDVGTHLEVAALSYGSTQIADVSAEARLLIEPPFQDHFGITTGAADVELDAISLPDTDVQNLTASLGGTPDSLRLEMRARVDGERMGELVASIDPRPDGRTAQLERFHLQLDEDEWELAQPARVSYADGYALRGFHLVAGDQAILVDGGVTAAGALDLSVQMDSTDVGTVTDLLGFPRLDGWLGGTVSLQGTTDAPSGMADLRAGFQLEGGAPTSLEAHLETEEGRVLTSAELRDPTGGILRLDGALPLRALGSAAADTAGAAVAIAPVRPPSPDLPRAERLDFQVTADAFDVSSAVAFVDPEILATLEGRIDANLQVGGSWRAPAFQGPVELSGGRAQLPELGVTWEEMRLHAHGSGNRLVVDSARVVAGPGYLSLTGNAIADGTLELDLAAYLQDFQAIQSEEYQAVVSGTLGVGGTLARPVVEGDVHMESLDVYLGERESTATVMDVELTEEDLAILRERFGYRPGSEDEGVPLTDLLTADLTVRLSRDSWLRKRTAPEMAVAFSGEVEVRLRPQSEPVLRGTVTTIADRGYIQQFGKRFDVREGTVTLDGPPDSARVDLSATYVIPSYSNPNNAEATIVLSVAGTQDDLALTLTSEPPMENADIVSFVATGRPAASNLAIGDGDADQAGADEQGGLAETGAGIALNQIVGAVERAAQEGVGLDVVEIRRQGIRGATLVAGKYLTPRLYVGVAQPVTHQEGDGLSVGDEGETQVEIEYEALRGLLLNIEGSDSALRIFLRGRVVY